MAPMVCICLSPVKSFERSASSTRTNRREYTAKRMARLVSESLHEREWHLCNRRDACFLQLSSLTDFCLRLVQQNCKPMEEVGQGDTPTP
mmetsp:Transcript_6810/g.17554  ORF Transcript_6810/g.17554 Transcript_6810/m.17554 type:complete len:90 (+) Transcript_6810:312-581(+)